MNQSVRMTRRFHPVISAFVVLMLLSMIASGDVFGSANIARAQETPLDTASVTPETALIFTAVSLATDSDQWQQASDVMVTLGLGSLEDLISEASSEGESDITFEDLEGGEVGVVVSSLEAASEATSDLSSVTEGLDPSATDTNSMTNAAASEDGIAIIFKVEDPAAFWTKVQADLEQTATDRGVTVETTVYEGVTIESLPPDEGTGESGTFQALVGDFIVVANRLEDIEPIIDTFNGTITPLSETANFQKLEPTLQQNFLVFGYVNGPALAAAGMTEGEFAAIGSVSAITAYTAFVGYIVDEGIRIDSVSVNEDGTAPILAPSGFTPSLATKVPEDTMLFIDGSDLAATGALDALALIFAQGVLGIETGATPSAGQTAEEYADEVFADSAQVIGFNLKTDLIDQLQGEYGLALWGLNMLDPSGLGFLFVTGVENQATVQDVVSKVSLLVQSAGGGEFTVSTRTVGESVVNSIDLSSSGFPLSLDYGVVGNELIISLGSGLEGYLSGQPTTLADNAEYTAALSGVPENPTSVFYVDLAQLIPLVESFTGSLEGSSSLDIEDASEKCADYDSQEAAQAAYDEDSFTNYELDQDFDGTACEDFFAPVGAEASPTPEFNFDALQSVIVVTYEKDGFSGATVLLAIA